MAAAVAAPARSDLQVEHYRSHEKLLRGWAGGAETKLDAIVVPASRPADSIVAALDLGVALDVTVFALCSGNAVSGDIAARAEEVRDARCVAVDLSRTTALPLEFATSAFPDAVAGRLGDLSLKRNLGLILGRLLDWNGMLFLDDDLRDLDPQVTGTAIRQLKDRAAVGMRAMEFPDNSVVCHAQRLGGQYQGVFVSGSALAVRCWRVDSFFPDIYNEDWFFLAPHLDRRDVSTVGSVRQLRYRPFANPARAASEEFGDVLAEGLIGYLHKSSLRNPLSPKYWKEFLRQRAIFIARAHQAIMSLCEEHPDAGSALRALEVAEKVRANISAETLMAYVEAWRGDLIAWNNYLRTLPKVAEVDAALGCLGLEAATARTDVVALRG